jgi:F-type H+-transporting ATPase subunit epsilon
MSNTIKLSIKTPYKIFYLNLVNMVILRITSGDIGILPGHIPFIGILDYSKLKIILNKKEKIASIMGGIVKVSKDEISLLTDTIEWAKDIDIDRARAALDRANDRISNALNDKNLDIDRARAALKRAKIRLDLIR